MSLTARMMLSLLTRQEVRRIVRYVMNRHSVNAVKRLDDVKVKLSRTWARLTGKKPLMMLPKASSIPYAIPIPTKIPTRDAPAAYSVPSKRNSLVSWLLFMPTERAIPISDFRSSASMMNMLMISTTPAMIVIVLRTVKRFVSCMAPVVALFTASIFDPYAQSSVVEFARTLGLVLHSKFGASG